MADSPYLKVLALFKGDKKQQCDLSRRTRLLIVDLLAKGVINIEGAEVILCGYEQLVEKLSQLGVKFHLVKEYK